MGVKVKTVYAERDAGRKADGFVCAVVFSVEREDTSPIQLVQYNKNDKKEYPVATVYGHVEARGTVKTGEKGDMLLSPVALTWEEKTRILDEAAVRLAAANEAPKNVSRFGIAPAGRPSAR